MRDPLPTQPRVFYGATPPAVPWDGDEWTFPAGSNGELWRFRYNAASANAAKWEYLGGSALAHYIATQETTASATAADMTTVGPTLTTPRAGDYEAEWGAWAYNSSVTGEAPVYLSVAGTVQNLVGFGIYHWEPSSGTGAITIESDSTAARINAVAASAVVKCMYGAPVGGTSNYGNRWLKLRPVRVQ